VEIALANPEQADGSQLCERCYLQTVVGDKRCCEGVLSGFAEALVDTLDLREHETGLHSRRVACHTLVLARHFTSDEQRLRQIYWGALLHDLGKIGVPDRILLKAEKLDSAEWQIMRRHPEDGFRIVSRLPSMEEAAEIVRCHEEHFDGSGYPGGLLGEAIPLGARIFSVIDALDAMTSDRPYRSAMSFDAAMAQIATCAGTQFDPALLTPLAKERDTLKRMVRMKCSLERHERPG
jgi:response regulator RpfG family c-di-GMP phosphodiesterase